MIETEGLFRLADAAEEAGDYDKAHAYFERCAALGEVAGLTRLAYLYDVGLGRPADKSKALRLYLQAWRHRDSVAANNIAVLHRERGKHVTMFRWLCRAAEAGDDSARVQMARCYLEGLGVTSSPDAAVRCLAAALQSAFISDEEREEAEELMNGLRPRSIS